MYFYLYLVSWMAVLGVLQAGEGERSVPQESVSQPMKKRKPHFVGVRREASLKSARKHKRIKSPWYQSKTQPKTAKQEASIQDPVELPEERPHFIKATTPSESREPLGAGSDSRTCDEEICAVERVTHQ